jgi:hypothetical protein
MEEWRYTSTFLDLGTGWKWSASRPGRFTARERDDGTFRKEGWLGPRVGLDVVETKRKQS